MAKLKKGQKVYRVKFAVFADIICDGKEPAKGFDDDREDEAYDAGMDVEYPMEETLKEYGFQNCQVGIDSVLPAPKYTQNREKR